MWFAQAFINATKGMLPSNQCWVASELSHWSHVRISEHGPTTPATTIPLTTSTLSCHLRPITHQTPASQPC